MSKNDERMTTVKGFIVKLNPDTLETEVTPFEENVKYTRTNERAASYVAEKIGLDANAMVKVTELVQAEYERRVYSPSEVYATACYRGRTYEMAEDGADDADPADVLDCKRIAVEVFDYSIVCMIQAVGGAYHAVKVKAQNVTECRAGLNQFQAYAEDVLQGKRMGEIYLYNADGSMTELAPRDLDYSRVAAWDSESRYRKPYRLACYLTDDELKKIPFTVYKRGDANDSADK